VKPRSPLAFALLAALASGLCQAGTGEAQETGVQSQKGDHQVPCDIAGYHALSETHFVQRTVVTLAKPSYPTEALKRGVEGAVLVDILVDRAGNVVKACALSGPELLRKSAEAAALACKFKKNFGGSSPPKTPYRRDTLPYLFVLDPAKKIDDVHHIVVQPTP
jgi:hypothetical protein